MTSIYSAMDSNVYDAGPQVYFSLQVPEVHGNKDNIF